MVRPVKPVDVKLTRNFKNHLASIEAFYAGIKAPRGFERVVDELLDTVIPNRQRFPRMGRPFLERSARSVEVTAAQAMLRAKRGSGELREYLLKTTVALYFHQGAGIHLLALKHQRQLTFDFEHLWGGGNV